MFETILVPLDGSTLAERAIPYASRLSRLSGAHLLLLNAIPSQGDPSLYLAAEAMLAAVAEKLRAGGLAVETRVVPGEAGRVIVEAVADGIGMIAMSTHGRGGPGRWLFGSVADQVLRHAKVPVLLVPAMSSAPWPEDRPLRVLVPLDGSTFAEAALGPVARLAVETAAEVLLLRVAERAASRHGWVLVEAELDRARRYLARVAETLRQDGVEASTRVIVGSPAPTIAAIAREQGADLIAMATHGWGGLARLVLGSVTTGTLQRSAVPVLVVRPAALGDQLSRATGEEGTHGLAVPTTEVPMTLAELDLVLRGLGELVYEPGQERPVVEAAWELLNRMKGAEADLYAQESESRG